MDRTLDSDSSNVGSTPARCIFYSIGDRLFSQCFMSTEDGSNKNNIDGNGTDKNSIDKEKTQEFLHKNGRYLIMAGMLVVILIGIVMLVNNKGTSSADPKARAEKVLKEDYQVDENEAVTKLMKNYYKYYAEGNVDKMKEIATPISKLEQSYIKMFSERVEKYKNIKCYTKEGLDKDSYIVSVGGYLLEQPL